MKGPAMSTIKNAVSSVGKAIFWLIIAWMLLNVVGLIALIIM
jgi:hypothetical protein